MNIDELKNKLKEAQIPNNVFNICEGGIRDQKMCLTKVDNKWAVFYSEKGQQFDYSEFSTEGEACAELYRRLI